MEACGCLFIPFCLVIFGGKAGLTAEALTMVQVMELVELRSLRDALVGMPGSSGLSVEQRKRLTIAVELVANPSIVFMDEPTSGASVADGNTCRRGLLPVLLRRQSCRSCQCKRLESRIT
jgi:ABC-type branched-subunit amino acid transport system ATPase component